MISHINWQSYWTFLAISIVLYYFIIISLFYNTELKSLLAGKRREVSPKPFPSYSEPPLATQPDLFDKDTVVPNAKASHSEEDTALLVQSLVDEVQAFLEGAQQAAYTKGQVISSLRQLLSKFPTLTYSPYKNSITHLIAVECENRCAIHLSSDDLNKVWKE